MHPDPRAEPVPELERGMRPDGDIVADDVVLADRGPLAGLEPGPDGRPGVDRGERPDDRAGADAERQLAVLLSPAARARG